MITIHNEDDYKTAMVEMANIFHDDPQEGSVEWDYYNHLVEAIMEYEEIHWPMEDE